MGSMARPGLPAGRIWRKARCIILFINIPSYIIINPTGNNGDKRGEILELLKITDGAYYLSGAVNLGVIAGTNGDAILIDAGIDESAARKAKRLIEAAGWNIAALLITHAHADHYGGAAYIVKTTGARVFAAAAEKSVMETPLLEPLYLFGGAYPPGALRSKFFLAQPLKVDTTLQPGLCRLAGVNLEIVALPGHSLGQIGVAYAGVLFCADAVVSPDVIQKHGIPLNTDIAATLQTYENLTQRKEAYFLLCHGGLTRAIAPIVAANRQIVNRVMEAVIQTARTPCTAEDIVSRVAGVMGLTITNQGQFYLTNLTIMAYISHLLDTRQLHVQYSNNRQIFTSS